MNRLVHRALICASLGMLVLSPAIANAATGKVTVAHNSGPLANAWFTATDPSGCIETDTFVSANRTSDHQSGADASTSVIAAVSIFQYDMCTDTVLLQAVGDSDTVASDDFTVSKQLDAATLDTVLTLTNIDSGEAFDVSVDVAWTGTTDITRDHSNTNDLYGGGCHVLNRWKGSGREAVATGTVSDGTTDFTPAGSQPAEIGYVIGGFAVMGCA